MAVNLDKGDKADKKTVAVPTPAAATAEPPQSIALELARFRRYIRAQDNQVWEKGVVYEVAADYGAQLLKLTDDFGYPIFVRERAKSAAAVAAKKAEEEAKNPRAVVRTPRAREEAPKGPTVVEAAKPKPVDLTADDNDEVAQRLAKLDAEGDDEGVQV